VAHPHIREVVDVAYWSLITPHDVVFYQVSDHLGQLLLTMLELFV
jgi:hypothetical protein